MGGLKPLKNSQETFLPEMIPKLKGAAPIVSDEVHLGSSGKRHMAALNDNEIISSSPVKLPQHNHIHKPHQNLPSSSDIKSSVSVPTNFETNVKSSTIQANTPIIKSSKSVSNAPLVKSTPTKIEDKRRTKIKIIDNNSEKNFSSNPLKYR